MAEPATASKPCTVCGIDCNGRPRVKDQQGRYMCQECFDKVKQTSKVQKAPPVTAAAAPTQTLAEVPLANDNSFLLDMGSKESTGTRGTKACPECARALPNNAVMCISCGYNLETGKRVPVKVVKAAKLKEQSESSPSAGLANSMIFCIIGGLIGAAIGCGIWTGITFATHREFGVIAWAVGGLTGAGCALGARGWAGMTSGMVGAILALLAIGLGRYFAYSMVLEELGFHNIPASEWYFDTISIFDGLWALLALGTAYRVGATEMS